MTQEEFNNLQPGDIIRHMGNYFNNYFVTANFGDRVTAVKTVDMTNPSEWVLVNKVTQRQKVED